MHRRARHFSMKAAGATLAFDARRISGVADGALLSTWQNDADPTVNATASSTLEPTYTETGMGGLPSVRFVTGKYMSFTAKAADPCTFVAVYRKTSGMGLIPLGNDSSTSGPHPIYDFTDSRFYVANAAGYKSSLGGNRTSPTVVATKIEASNSFTLRVNGATITLGVLTNLAGQTTINRVGSRANTNTSNGDMSLIAFIQSGIAVSLIRRLEHAAAFSFKIKCS